ncbi:MAG: T9SS type A sorting domain-containing protein, partial [Ignavibacteria bacterium]|nr:T9SS type A sorting domain-containing protein [Ignavibacteria bacterium]
RFVFTTGPDSTVTVFNSSNNQLFTFYFNRQPTHALFDPENYIVLKSATTIGVKEVFANLPSKYELEQNYPNPFNSTTKIKFSIPERTFVKLKIYDMLGREIAEVVNKEIDAGVYEVNWDIITTTKKELTSGVYFYRMETEKYSDVKRMVLVK